MPDIIIAAFEEWARRHIPTRVWVFESFDDEVTAYPIFRTLDEARAVVGCDDERTFEFCYNEDGLYLKVNHQGKLVGHLMPCRTTFPLPPV